MSWDGCFNEAGILHPGMRRTVPATRRATTASMRPGFYIPECAGFGPLSLSPATASMRPGFYIPECFACSIPASSLSHASMRPGFYIPECQLAQQQQDPLCPGFNEAGILHPGMLSGKRRLNPRN